MAVPDGCEISNKTYRNVGGAIHGKFDRRIPDEVREQIRAEYIKRDLQFGGCALSRKYGVNRGTIERIVKERK